MIGDHVRCEDGVMSFDTLPHTATYDPAAGGWRVSWCPDRLFDEQHAVAALELSRLASGYRLVQAPPASGSGHSHVCAHELPGLVVRDEKQIRRIAGELGIDPTTAIRSIRAAEQDHRDRTDPREIAPPAVSPAPAGRPFRVLVTGSRQWTDTATISDALQPYRGRGAVLVHGDARGADQLAGALWQGWGEQVEPHPADWAKHGRAAGFVRNAAMVELGADVCLAFIRDASAGATHTADTAEHAGIDTRRYMTHSEHEHAMTVEPGWSR